MADDDLTALREREPDARFVLEQLTSMLRHGMTRRDLAAAATALGSGRSGLRGVAMHLPLNTTSHLGEVSRLINDVVASGLPTRTVFVSHLTEAELRARGRRRGRSYVYRRDGEPCRVCGAKVRTQELQARNLFWCPRCQPKFRSRAQS